MPDYPEPRRPGHYGTTTGDSPYRDGADADTRNGGGGDKDKTDNLNPEAEHERVECPLCGEAFGTLPKHLRRCDG